MRGPESAQVSSASGARAGSRNLRHGPGQKPPQGLGAGAIVAAGEAGAAPQRAQQFAQRRRQPRGFFPDVEPGRVEAERLDLPAYRPQPVMGQRGGQRAGDEIQRPGKIGKADARRVGRRLEEARGHVVARGRLQVGGEQGEDEPIGLIGVARVEIGARAEGGGARPASPRGRGAAAPAAR